MGDLNPILLTVLLKREFVLGKEEKKKKLKKITSKKGIQDMMEEGGPTPPVNMQTALYVDGV